MVIAVLKQVSVYYHVGKLYNISALFQSHSQEVEQVGSLLTER